MKPNIRQLKRWIAALDSGEYKQDKDTLQTKHGYCCFGVGCEIFVPNSKKVLNQFGHMYGIEAGNQPSAPAWLKSLNYDFVKKTGRNLTDLNDSGYTFSEIATLLELVYIHKMLD